MGQKNFSSAYFEQKEENKLGTKQAGYLEEEIKKAENLTENHHQANFADTLNNIVNTITSNANAVQQLTATNKN